MSQFGINFIHVINFSDVQNVLCISVMYVMSRIRICIGGVGAGKDLAQGAHKSVNGLLSEPAKHDLTLSRSLQNIKGTTSVFYISWFLFISWLRHFYPSRFMSKPSLNHVSVIKCSQTRKRCWNASIIVVSSLIHGLSNFFILRPI